MAEHHVDIPNMTRNDGVGGTVIFAKPCAFGRDVSRQTRKRARLKRINWILVVINVNRQANVIILYTERRYLKRPPSHSCFHTLAKITKSSFNILLLYYYTQSGEVYIWVFETVFGKPVVS